MLKEFAAQVGLVEPLVAPHAEAMRVDLATSAPGLDGDEREAMCQGFSRAAETYLLSRLERLLRLEYQAARATTNIDSSPTDLTPLDFSLAVSRRVFWDRLAVTYPALASRVESVLTSRRRGAAELASRLCADRSRLAEFIPDGRMSHIEFGTGDSHNGGRAVARLDFDGRSVHYKPRSLRVDRALRALISEVHAYTPDAPLLVVPRVILGEDYGWAEHVESRSFVEGEERAEYYRRSGSWLALADLLGGTDLHWENVVAAGGSPVVVDCETMFTPVESAGLVSGADAVRRARKALTEGVTRTGLLPRPHPALPGKMVPGGIGQHGAHELADFAGTVAVGFHAYHRALRAFDADGRLAPALEAFGDCQVRIVLRPSQLYFELIHGLWHPASLYDMSKATDQVERILVDRGHIGIPSEVEQDVVAAEIDQLLVDDVPIFTCLPSSGNATDAVGNSVKNHGNLVETALRRWRRKDPHTDLRAIRTILSSRTQVSRGLSSAPALYGHPLSVRKRALMERVVDQLADAAMWGDDGTVAWMALRATSTFTNVEPPSLDLYSGLGGVLVALAAYRKWADLSGIPAVPATDQLIRGLVHTLSRGGGAEQGDARGGFTGTASLLPTWMILERLGVPGARRRARSCADDVGVLSFDATETVDLIGGPAGLIVPLLGVARRNTRHPYLDAARRLAEVIELRAETSDNGVWWPSPDGSVKVGFAHGATGVGWALGRLGLATREPHWIALARRAFEFADHYYYYSSDNIGWAEDTTHADVRPVTWCRGSVGIGLAAWDLHQRHVASDGYFADIAHRARATLTFDDEHDSTLCHGILGQWELARALDTSGPTHGLDEAVLTHLEDDLHSRDLGPRWEFVGLLDGLSGLVYQLARSDFPGEIPSVLLIESGD
ncbi:type 2 lanthipeptide synthetase LanM family protein [Actinokineospora sp. HUAS TT18]|uniref:type 2 lanthipeptide synthetase LanM family protein n=1 Tax=Actinokineospora sp. HUAS TT18 TaxID=3447451 RepID=UPI003F51CFC1